MKLSIGAKIGLGYGVVTLIMAAIGLASYTSVKRFIATAEQVEYSHRILEEIPDVVEDLLSVETGQRGYTVTGNANFLDSYKTGLNNIERDIVEVSKLVRDSEVQEQLDTLKTQVRSRIEFSQRVVSLMKSGDRAAAVRLTASSQGKREMNAIRQAISKIRETEDARLKQRTEESNATARNMTLTVALGIPLSVLLLCLIGILTVRDISRPLQQITVISDSIAAGDLEVTLNTSDRGDEIGMLTQSFSRMIHSLQNMARAAGQVASGNLAVEIKPQSEKDVVGNALTRMTDNLSGLIGQVQKSGIQVNASATEIAATAKQQQATAGEISATTTEIGATAREIAATSRELVSAMREVTEVAEETATLAGSGQSGLTRMGVTMRQIMEAGSSINARLAVLNEKAVNINSVVTTITKVADQTNLLSLNAAIEAEKAGEYGRGFSVVATEIRRLADQTAVATYDIEQIVKEMQSAVSAGVMGMDKFSEEVRRGVDEVEQVSTQLVQIIQQVQALTPNFETVNEGMQSQSLGAQQISEALTQLSEAAQQTVESLRQSNIAIEQLNDATHGLQEGVSHFTLQA